MPFLLFGARGSSRSTIAEINRLEPTIATRSNAELANEATRLRQDVARELGQLEPSEFSQKTVDRVLDRMAPPVFALTREAARRELGLRHYDVQLTGGLVLHQGKIAEMKTGEGKTLVATLPLVLNAMAGRGAHLVTVNDYLAKRDAGWMGPVYSRLGLTVAVIGHEQSWLYDPVVTIEDETDRRLSHFRPISRPAAYAADITYGTNNEFGFDYLRDHMELSVSRLRQRPFWYGIVDEVDSILIDEARTPLIISGPASESTSLYATFADIVPQLKPGTDFTVDEKARAVAITDSGIAKVERAVGVAHLYDSDHILLVHHLEEALKAHALFRRNKDYVVKDGEVVIVDEFTGRLMPGRRYSEGLHQAIEAKEKVEVQRESETLATISFQNLFRLYPKLAGMTGTAATEAEEFYKIYHLDVVTVLTHRPNIRRDRHDLIYKTEAAKLDAVIGEIVANQKRGRPVLVGSISVAKSERLSRRLKQVGIEHQVLNAKHHQREAKVIQNAGLPGTVTVATNMAGRGVDIVLGGVLPDALIGTPQSKPVMKTWEQNHQKVLAAGGLLVIGTERHESRRIDNQLRGRSARQGDPGESVFYVSTEDDLMRIFGGDKMKSLMGRLGLSDDQPITHSLITRSIESAQKRVEGHNFDIRKHLVEYDDVMNKHREILYRKRQRVLRLETELGDNKNQGHWLHRELLEIMTEEESGVYDQKVGQFGLPVIEQAERLVYLQTIDAYWREHLTRMEELRTGIGLQGYAQTDPLVAYKRHAFEMFERLLTAIDTDVTQTVLRLEISHEPAVLEATTGNLTFQGANEALAGGGIMGEATAVASPASVTRDKQANEVKSQTAGLKVGRNDPCPCGAKKSDGTLKKFKHCHGQ